MLALQIETTGDILNLAIAVGFLMVSIFLTLVLVRLFLLLGKLKRIVQAADEIVAMVNLYLWKPVSFLLRIWHKISGR